MNTDEVEALLRHYIPLDPRIGSTFSRDADVALLRLENVEQPDRSVV